MVFPDFPFPSYLPSFPSHHDVLKYLQQYADHYDLTRCIRFGTLVEEVIAAPIRSEDEDGLDGSFQECNNQEQGFFNDSVRWKITTQDLESGERTLEYFDAVLVCNG